MLQSENMTDASYREAVENYLKERIPEWNRRLLMESLDREGMGEPYTLWVESVVVTAYGTNSA